MDWEQFRQHMLVDQDRAVATVETRLRATRHMERAGFSWLRFCEGPEQALREGRRFLAIKKVAGKRHAMQLYAKTLNDLARWRGYDLHFPLAKAPSGHPDPYTPEQLAALAAYAHPVEFVEKRRKAMLWLCQATGLRRAEIARVRLADLDRGRGGLHIPNPAKDGKPRTIPLPADAWSPKRALVAYLVVRAAVHPASDALWVTRRGSQMPVAVVGREMWEIGEALGFLVSFNRFRRTRATMLNRSGVELGTLQSLYGHADPKSTRWYYEPQVDDLREALRRARVPGFVRSRSTSHKEVGKQDHEEDTKHDQDRGEEPKPVAAPKAVTLHALARKRARKASAGEADAPQEPVVSLTTQPD